MPAPQITLLDDSSAANEKVLRLRLDSAREPSTLWVSVQNATILRSMIDGKKAPSKMVEPHDKLWGFYLITLTDQTNSVLEVQDFTASQGTPDLMPLNYFPAFDSTTLVTKTFMTP